MLHSNNSQQAQPKCIEKWNHELEQHINLTAWKDILNIAHKTINDNEFRWFQLQILHRILGMRYLQHKMKICDTPYCGLCDSVPETLSHLFVDCTVSNMFLAFHCNLDSTKKHRIYYLF